MARSYGEAVSEQGKIIGKKTSTVEVAAEIAKGAIERAQSEEFKTF